MEQKLPDPLPSEPPSVKFEVVDVGGQRNERRKWMNVFSNVNAILFIESLAGYHQVLFEDNTKLRMYESLDLFHSITNKPDFQHVPICLFLSTRVGLCTLTPCFFFLFSPRAEQEGSLRDNDQGARSQRCIP